MFASSLFDSKSPSPTWHSISAHKNKRLSYNAVPFWKAKTIEILAKATDRLVDAIDNKKTVEVSSSCFRDHLDKLNFCRANPGSTETLSRIVKVDKVFYIYTHLNPLFCAAIPYKHTQPTKALQIQLWWPECQWSCFHPTQITRGNAPNWRQWHLLFRGDGWGSPDLQKESNSDILVTDFFFLTYVSIWCRYR